MVAVHAQGTSSTTLPSMPRQPRLPQCATGSARSRRGSRRSWSGLRSSVPRCHLPHRGRRLACSVEHLVRHDGAFGECAGLVVAQDVYAAEVLPRCSGRSLPAAQRRSTTSGRRRQRRMSPRARLRPDSSSKRLALHRSLGAFCIRCRACVRAALSHDGSEHPTDSGRQCHGEHAPEGDAQSRLHHVRAARAGADGSKECEKQE